MTNQELRAYTFECLCRHFYECVLPSKINKRMINEIKFFPEFFTNLDQTIKKYPNIRWIQSFADERCGKNGIVYQAANFGYYGEHSATFWTLGSEIYHNSLMTRNPKLSKAAARLQENKDKATASELRQFRYIYFIHKSAVNDCLLERQDYPKHYEET